MHQRFCGLWCAHAALFGSAMLEVHCPWSFSLDSCNFQEGDPLRWDQNFTNRLPVAGMPADVYVEVRWLLDPPQDDLYRWSNLDTDWHQVLYIKTMPVSIGKSQQ